MSEYDPDPVPRLPAADALRDAVGRARRGDREALAALRAALDAHPEIWLEYGDLAAHAERSWIEMTAGPDMILAEALGRKVAAMKADLSGPTPTALERLLAARVAACWLQVYYSDAAVAQAGNVSIRQADMALRRQDRAHRGYLAAIAALATVRRLLPFVPGSAGDLVELPEPAARLRVRIAPAENPPAKSG